MDAIDKAFNIFFDGKIKEAKEFTKRLLKHRKKDPRLWLLKSLIDREEGMIEDALESVDRAIELKPNYVEAWIFKGIILRLLDQYEEAIRAFEEAMKIQLNEEGYEDYELLIEEARTYIMMGDKRKALEILEKVSEINPEDDDLKELLGGLSIEEKGDRFERR